MRQLLYGTGMTESKGSTCGRLHEVKGSWTCLEKTLTSHVHAPHDTELNSERANDGNRFAGVSIIPVAGMTGKRSCSKGVSVSRTKDIRLWS